MKIIAHRINTISLLKTVPEHYGIEIDVRTDGKKIILNHEPFSPGPELNSFLAMCKNRFIIFNIKEAGIEDEVIKLANVSRLEDFFLLDVEFPFLYRSSRTDKFRKIAARFSEAEPIEFVLEQYKYIDWVWIDTITKLPLTKEVYEKLAGLRLCLVSPDRWNRTSEIKEYKQYLIRTKININAVMVSLEHAKEWE